MSISHEAVSFQPSAVSFELLAGAANYEGTSCRAIKQSGAPYEAPLKAEG
jgi:hypothetical protein